jgi:hypothetical protein
MIEQSFSIQAKQVNSTSMLVSAPGLSGVLTARR